MTFHSWSYGTRVTLTVDPEMLTFELPEQLIEAGVLEAQDDANTSYLVGFAEKDHRLLDMEHSLDVNGVVENDALIISTAAVAYGCPTAENLPGIVPECMLTHEESPEHIEL